MVWFVILGVLAAFGLWCCIYCVAGFFLPDKDSLVLICRLPRDRLPDGAIARYRWMKGLGLIHTSLLIIGQSTSPADPDIKFCTVEELSARLELERNKLD